MASTKTSVYMTDALREKLRIAPFGERGASEAVSLTIDRYSLIVKAEKKKLQGIFSDNEFLAMFNACSSASWRPAEACRDGVLHNVQDSTKEELSMYDVDRTALEEKLQSLSVSQQLALVEMVEAYWESQK